MVNHSPRPRGPAALHSAQWRSRFRDIGILNHHLYRRHSHYRDPAVRKKTVIDISCLAPVVRPFSVAAFALKESRWGQTLTL